MNFLSRNCQSFGGDASNRTPMSFKAAVLKRLAGVPIKCNFSILKQHKCLFLVFE
jgi:hypothetical protein